MTILHNKRIFKDRRSELRQRSTETEDKLWFYLRSGRLKAKFKRQHSIGGYILDFYCAEKRLIIELDGESHTIKEVREYDEVRDKYFKEIGYRTLRFSNKDIETGIKNVLNKIKDAIKTADASPHPLQGEGKGER